MEGSTGSDAPRRTVRDVLADAFAGWGAHGNSQMAAAIAYYSALTLAPTLLLALMVASLVFDRAMIAEQLSGNLSEVLGSDSVELLASAIQSLFDLKSSSSLVFVGMFTLLLGATGLLLQVRVGLRRIWGSVPTGSAVRTLLHERGAALLAFGVLVAALVLLVGVWWAISLTAPERAGGSLQQLATTGLGFALALAAYRFFPAARVTWRAALLGAAIAAVGWAIAAEGIGIYFGIVPTATLYGAASSLIILLVWVYVMSMILLFGGEVARAFDHSPA